ncbi:MAG: hypothetical protein J3K34DRAFT_165468 [Monoraphidium minutum]|nr:MAG: hypothetical protein J3K34DRAFT_165468 [Monoraphidium minutum]
MTVDAAPPPAANAPAQAGAVGWAAALREYCRTHPSELAGYILDAATAVLVVAVQDVAFKEAITACAALSVASLLCNWHAARLGQRVVFPKSIELMVPALCVGLVAPAWVAEEATHRVVYLVICGTAAATMLATVLMGRSFAMEYFMDWYPEPFWGTPLVRRLTAHLAWVWIAGQAIMAAAAAVIVVKGSSNEALYITFNYVLQLLPLLISVIATVAYPRALKRRWGYDPSDPLTGYPPSQRGAAAARDAERGARAAPRGSCFGGGGRGGGAARVGSRQRLLGSWLLLGHDAAAGPAPGSGGGDAPEVVVGPALTPTRRSNATPRGSSADGGGGGGGGGGGAI